MKREKSEEFELKIGVHQGSALSSSLTIIVREAALFSEFIPGCTS